MTTTQATIVPPEFINMSKTHSRRHVIVEGPDGGGKTQLVNALLDNRYPDGLNHRPDNPTYPGKFRVYPKASKSTGPDVGTLANWSVQYSRATTFETRPGDRWVTDRHPIISEPIYGPIIRSGVPKAFNDRRWFEDIRSRLYQTHIVVWCFPPPEVVSENVSGDRDMLGVDSNIREIYAAYIKTAMEWGGPFLVYDYTKMDPRDLARLLNKGLTRS